MIIAIDDGLIYYAVKRAVQSGDADEVNYICNRVIEACPNIPKGTTMQLLQQVDDFMKLEPKYMKYAPFNRLQEALQSRLNEFKKGKGEN